MQLSTPKFLSAIFGVLAMALVTNAQAALITETFDVAIVDYFGYAEDVIDETGSIDVTYDTDDVDAAEEEVFLDESLFDLSLSLFGQTFVDEQDTDYPFLPELTFFFGELGFIDFVIDTFSPFNPVTIFDGRVDSFGGGDVFDGVWEVTAFGPAVPTPATLGLIAIGMLGSLLVRRKQS